MKKFIAALFIVFAFQVDSVYGTEYPNFIFGTPNIQSVSALAFGPDGILFVGDAQSAVVFAIATDDTKAGEKVENISIVGVDNAIAKLLGMGVADFSIVDMAVNPVSKNLFVAVQHSSGKSIILKYANGEFSVMPMENVKFSSSALENAITEGAKDGRGRSQRRWAISDLDYYDGKVLLSGLSNQEFGSTFRSIPFPFKDAQSQSSLEIYHAAHGRYETQSPIKTFTAASIDGTPYLIASYTCTPLVLFPLNDLKTGQHVKGRTVAELGSNNSPVDMITMEKDGKKYLLMAHSNRAVMKIKFEDIKEFKASLTTPVEESSATAGVDFIALPLVGVQQLDVLDETHFVVLQRMANGSLDVVTQSNRWL